MTKIILIVLAVSCMLAVITWAIKLFRTVKNKGYLDGCWQDILDETSYATIVVAGILMVLLSANAFLHILFTNHYCIKDISPWAPATFYASGVGMVVATVLMFICENKRLCNEELYWEHHGRKAFP